MYSQEELGFILYNNRSVKGVVSNFLPKLNPVKLIKIESRLDDSKKIFNSESRMVEVSKDDLDLNQSDVVVTKEELSSLSELIKTNIGNFNDVEYQYISERGFGDSTILDWKILGLSSIKNKKDLITLGATVHPILANVIQDGIENGGIVIPLFENEKLVNCAIRKINSHKSLKYTLSCPDIPVWGLDRINTGQEIWITEGLFDMMALFKLGKRAVSCSSAMWTGIQLYKVLEKKPSSIVIFSDKDSVGLRTSAILKNFFNLYNIPCKILISEVAKDPAEHYFQKDQNINTLVEIEVTNQMIDKFQDESFNFLKYLKNRKY